MKIKSIKNVGRKKVYDLSVKDVEHYVLENGVVTHNTGIMYSADTVIMLGKQQEKDGKEIIGYHFIMNEEKSRFVKEKSKIPLTVTFDKGIDPYSGLLDIAMEVGYVVKPSNGWYSRAALDHETGELVVEDQKFRAKDTNNAAFWKQLIQNVDFKQAVKDKFCLGQMDNSEMMDEADALFN